VASDTVRDHPFRTEWVTDEQWRETVDDVDAGPERLV
jgi:hypothetical protein